MGPSAVLSVILNAFIKLNYGLELKLKTFLLIFAFFYTGNLFKAELNKPCEFPSPEYLQFSRLCQFDYHQVPYLCDPSGMMSRTETEILDRQVHRLSNGYKPSGCVCPPLTKFKKRVYSTKFSLNNENDKAYQTSPTISETCNKNLKNEINSIRIAVILVPFSSLEGVNICLQRRRQLTDTKYNQKEVSVNNFSDATLSYAKQLLNRWIATANSSNTTHDNQTSCDQIDLFIVYIQNWMPTNIHRPYIARILNHRLKHVDQFETVHQIKEDVTSFEAIMREITLAMKFIKGNSVGLHQSTDLTKDGLEEYNNNITGVPTWAYVLVICLITIVLITVYIGNCVNRRLTISQQQKKYSAAMNARGANIAAGNGNERGRAGFGGGFLMNTSGAGAGGSSGGATSNSAVSGPSGASSSAATKSSMMFRQFSSGPSRRQGTARNVTVQKI